jgi:hypothetical protein
MSPGSVRLDRAGADEFSGIDDQTAIQVTDGTVEVVSEGHWKLFTASESR